MLSFAGNALDAAAGRVAVLDIMAVRLTEPNVFHSAISRLFNVLDSKGHGGTVVTGADAAALSKRWQAFLIAHRSEIEAGKRFALNDRAVAGLVPPGWTIR